MKKYGYRCAVLIFLLAISFNSFAQRQKPVIPQPSQFLPAIKKQIAKQKSSATARTLSCSYDSLVFTRQSQIDSFPITNPGCTVLRELKIYGDGASPAITSLDSLYAITEITSFFEVDHTSLTDLSGLSGLQRTAWLWLGYNPLMTNVMPPNLTYVGSVLLNELPLFTSFNGFTQNLTSSRLGYLWMFNNVGITNFAGLESLDSVDNIGVFGLPNLISFQGLQNVVYCHDIGLFGCGNLTDVSALSGITELPWGSLKINYNWQLTSWNGLQNITRIGGILEVLGSPVTSLSGLNSNLIIENSNNPTVDTLRIEDNFQLSACSFNPLCEYLDRSNAVSIRNNDLGCSSIAEIKANCGLCTVVGVKTWTAATNDEWTEPTNWFPVGVPQLCDSVIIPIGASDRPRLMANTVIHALTMESGTELFYNGYGLKINGDVNVENVLMGGGTYLYISNAQDISIINSTLYIDSVAIDNYRQFFYISGNNFQGALFISDYADRGSVSTMDGNSIGGNFTIVSNSIYGYAETKLSENVEDYVYGTSTFICNSSAPLRVGAGQAFRFIGDVVVNSNIYGQPQIENIEFNGSLNPDIHLRQTGTQPIIIQRGTAFRFGPSFIIPDQHVYISSEFRFISGIVKTTDNGMFIFTDGANTTAWSGGSYVWGPIKRTGSNGFTFSVGDSIYRSVVHMSSLQNSLDTIRVQYFHKNPATAGYNTSLLAASLDSVSSREYWQINEIEGPMAQRSPQPLSNNLQFTFYYDSVRSGAVQSLQHLRIARWNGSLWEDKGLGSASGNLAEADITHSGILSQFGIFSFGFDSYKPIITIGQVDTLVCGNRSFKVPVNVDSPMAAGNYYYVHLSDSSGSFANLNIIGLKQGSNSDTINAFVGNINIPDGNNYKIKVTASSPLDTSTNIVSIKFKQPPVYYSLAGPGTICVGQTYKYYPVQKQQGVTYTWTLTEGNATITTNHDTVYVTPTAAGQLSLGLQTANVCLSVPSGITGITVLPPPPTQTPTINNIGRWLYASALPASVTGYHWFRNDTLISGTNVSSYYASLAGNYYVKFFVTCGDGPASNSISFSVNSIPQTITFPTITDKLFNDATFSLGATTSSGLPVQYILLSGPGSISGDVYTINGTGAVIIQAIQPGDNVYDTAAPVTRTFIVNKGLQNITFPTISNQTLGAPPVSLNATSSSGLAISYSIVSGPAFVSGSLLYMTGVGSVTVRASQAGNANYLSATPVDQTFCISANALTSIFGPQYLCPGQMASYSVNNIANVTYSWRLSNGTTFPSTTNTVSFSIATPGTYTLYVSATGPCGTASTESSYTINIINAVTPGAVSNMVPANGATGQELPLQLSWIPGSDAFTYDIYVWDAEADQPSTPFAPNRTGVSYTILANALAYHRTYKWRIVSKNGCLQTEGPIQTFTLKPLPDLMVSHVQAPSSANSGQTISFSWRVTNNGPGHTTTNQRWTDAVFLSFDSTPVFNVPPATNSIAWSILDFPIRPLLVGTRQNPTALDSGQHYTNTIDFTLPLNYSQPLYVYVITNFPASTNAPLQMTYANDSARASQPVNVTLSPTPDLRVDTVLTPSSVFSGSTINLTYKVKNYGVLTPAGSSWTDVFYISQSPIFNINTAVQLKAKKLNGSYYPNAFVASAFNNTQLQADSSYTVNTEVVIPNFIFGTYFIYVRTNAGISLYEGALSNNNIGAAQLQVFLTPTPQLTVNSLTVPLTTASITQLIGINWNIFNAGFNDNIEKNKGHYFVRDGSCTIACFPNGSGEIVCTQGNKFRDSLGFGGSYWVDRVYLSTDPSGLNANAIQIAEVPQGTANSGLFVVDNVQADKCLIIGNQGGSLNDINVIMPGTNHPSNYNFRIPANLLPGNYYVYVLANANKHVYEYPGTPQVRRSDLPILVQRPDVTPSSVTVPANSTGGQPVTIQYQITNNGPGSVFVASRRDRIYISTSPVFDGTAELLTTINHAETIAAGASVTHSYTKTFAPGTSGMRYFFVHTNYDSLFRETNYGNNVSAAASSNFATAVANDLVVSTFTMADSVFAIFNTPIKYEVVNNGAGTINGSWTDSLFISCNSTFSQATSFYIGRRDHNRTVAPGSSYSDSFNVNIPFGYSLNSCFPTATYSTAYLFVKTNANDGVYEGSNNNNNLLSSGIRVLINPSVDHIVTNVSGAASALVARPYTISWQVKNLGFDPGPPHYIWWFDGIYFSADSVFDAGDRLVEHFYETQRLGTAQTYSRTKSITVPNLAAGDYYLFAVTDNYHYIGAEYMRSNNANLIRNADGSAKKIMIAQPPLPDLVDTMTTIPASVAVGQPLQVIHTIKNIGVGDVYPPTWSNELYLSTDFIVGNGNDIKLASKTFNAALAPGQTLTDTITATVNINAIEGNYILIMRTDAGSSIVETDDLNNLNYRFITVYRPAPSDLVVEQINKPDTVLLGYTIDTAKWVIANNSPNNAEGVSTDGIYLSKSTTLDSTATLIGVVPKQINIPALTKDTVSSRPLVSNVVEGNYNLLVKTDLLNNIVESEKNNNTGISAGKIYVKVKELPLNITENNTLHTINRYYKLIIPDSLRGSTILVTLKTGDSLSVRNEMFIGLGYIPTPAHFDYRFETPNAGNQQIVMTSVVDSVYYITVRVVSANPPVQNITLKAVKLPFAILNVQSSQGGNIGNVTVRISGSLFTNNMTAKLTRSGTSINASAIYFTNSTQVYATFNLQGKPLGLYDVTLMKPDTTEATLANGFSVVNANNGGLITGGGINTGQNGSGNEPGCDPGAASGLNSQLVVELVVPEKVFAGWPFVIQVNYTNPTNFDVPAQARILYNNQGVPVALSQAGFSDDKTSLYLELTEPGGPPGIIRAGASGSIIIYGKAPVTMPGHTFVKFNLK